MESWGIRRNQVLLNYSFLEMHSFLFLLELQFPHLAPMKKLEFIPVSTLLTTATAY